MDWDGIGAKKFIGLENYINGIKDMKFWSSAYHSFLLAIFSTLSLGTLFVSIINIGIQNKRSRFTEKDILNSDVIVFSCNCTTMD